MNDGTKKLLEIIKKNKIDCKFTIIEIGALEVSKKEFNETNQLLKLKIRNKFGEAIPLEKIVSFQEAKGASSIQRLNGSRTITLFGEVDETVISGKEANKKLKPFLNKLSDKHPGLRFGSGGREKKRMEAVTDTMKLYIFALVLIFMVISLSFQSVWIPLYVMVSIPVGLAGVIWALLIHGQTLSMMGCIGIVGLSGVVVNVSILFMSFIRDKLKEGQDLFTAIENSAVERLRPIVITTITTLVGLIPTIYGIGGTDTFVQPLALALGWGLFIATTISLATLPALVATTWRRS